MNLLHAHHEIFKPTGWGHHESIWNANGNIVRPTLQEVEIPVYIRVGYMWQQVCKSMDDKE